ncbi:thioesterase [Rahnella sp. AA]|uniref:hotdog fold thioesterase n=1 Tax=Rahnella sp. AA TaxID=2057180 RepID=UPI000C328137|nr:hotdog fold thioesterase [Rahnella sp. AA]PKE30236.1 thioesterase [Rahnella sp. AA]
MPFWKRSATLEMLNGQSQGCMVGHVGIEFTRLGDDFLEATMPVDTRTTQPFGLLHGGASVVLAETMGSMAGYLCSEGKQTVVGVEINASHMHSAREGRVRGVCRALRIGRRSQVWQIEIFDQAGNLCCVSRLTTMVIDH